MVIERSIEFYMKEVYRSYLLRVMDVVNLSAICRLASVDYVNLYQFIKGEDNRISINALKRVCQVIGSIEKIA